jgi:hypothetical protein
MRHALASQPRWITESGAAWIQKMLMARAASSAMIAREMSDCVMTANFAQRPRTAVSVGEKAVLVLKAKKR